MGSDSEDIQQRIGCGGGSDSSQITLNINTTTGGSFSVNVDNQTSVENLKKLVAKKLKVAKDRICLLHREKELHEGTTIKDNGIMDGGRIILLPNVETGLLAQRPENTVMQALESLNESQVNDFLSGKTPLNLSMRLGDHMMLIQLQLSTVNPSNTSASTSTASTSSASGGHSTRELPKSLKPIKNLTNLNMLGNRSKTSSLLSSIAHHSSSAMKLVGSGSSGSSKSPHGASGSSTESIEAKSNLEKLRQIASILERKNIAAATSSLATDPTMETSDNEQSPIKSLSNLVSSPMETSSIKSIPLKLTPNVKHTSCPCKSSAGTDDDDVIDCDSNCQCSRNDHHLAHKRLLSNHSELKNLTRSSALLHRTINNAITKTKANPSSSSFNPIRPNPINITNLRRSKSTDNITHHEQGVAKMVSANSISNELAANKSINVIDTATGNTVDGLGTTETLAEASRNLTKTLRKLSKEVFSSKGESSTNTINDEKRTRSSSSNIQSNASCGSLQNSSIGLGSGAVIESMRNHGRGIYSGTFSGTLNPALQDRFGRPKRDISTVIHILNDLLSATPHYSRGARISFEPAHSSRSGKYTSSKRITSSSANPTRTHCTKCPQTSRKLSECSSDCVRVHRHSSKHTSASVTNELKQKLLSRSSLLPIGTSTATTTTTITKSTSVDCRQCQMPLISNSAPVTPTKSPSDQLAELKEIARNSNASSPSTSNFDIRSSSNNLASTCSSLLVNTINDTATTTPNSFICTKCSNMEIENNKTKTKLDQLRLVMQQRRERREARKLRSAPYGGRIIGASAAATTTNTASTSTNQNETTNNGSVISATVEGPPTNTIVEQVNTLA